MCETPATFRDPTAWGNFQKVLNSIPLPSGVRQLAEVIGREATLRLVARLPRAYSKGRPSGQVMLYVPHHSTPGHRLVEILGERDAAKLVRVFAGEVMLLPVCTDVGRTLRDQAIQFEIQRGATTREICKLFCLSPSRVRAIKQTKGFGRGSHRRKGNFNQA